MVFKNDTLEYEIFIGCTDSQTKNELVHEEELMKMISTFFARNEIDFSLLKIAGGYLYEDGNFIMEDGVCINIIGDSDLDIISLAKSLSMFMNQESVLITRNSVKSIIQ